MAFQWVGGHLPEKYRFAHQFAFDCHDRLAHFVQLVEENGLTRVSFAIRSEEDQLELKGLAGERLFDWLEAKGYSETVGQIAFRSCVHALLGDMCHFIYEALRCSEKAKLTVAFALLRKPLRENLLFLEHLLAAPNDFLDSMWSDRVGEVAVDRLLRERRVPDIILKANALTQHSTSRDPSFIYELRYDSTKDYSYDQIWHKAIHLVTTRKATATEAKNLNFIFSDVDSHLDQWDHIYATLPFLLFYAVDVCTSLLLAMGAEQLLSPEDSLRRSLGFILWSTDPARMSAAERGLHVEPSPLHCPECQQAIPFVWSDFRNLYYGSRLRCLPCRRRFKLAQFVTQT